MITIYKNGENGLEMVPEVGKGCWIHVVEPTTDEIERLSRENIPQDFLTYPLDLDERSRTEREDDGTLLILLRVPYYQGIKTDIPYITIPIGIILTEHLIVTVCRRPHDILMEFASGRMKGLHTGKRHRFILRLMLAIAQKYLAYLSEINKITETLEDRLQASQRNRELLELVKYQKSLVYFTVALKSNELTLERLQRWQLFNTYADDEDLLEDVLTENRQAMEMTAIASNILSSMMDAFASIISNNLNVVMKFLTSMTIVVSIPTIVTSFFGMNVDLPFQTHPFAYLLVIGISLLIALGLVFFFIRRDWF